MSPPPVSYQRPSSPSWTTSTTSPLLTASASGLPFSSPITTVYLPGTWWRGTRHIKHSSVCRPRHRVRPPRLSGCPLQATGEGQRALRQGPAVCGAFDRTVTLTGEELLVVRRGQVSHCSRVTNPNQPAKRSRLTPGGPASLQQASAPAGLTRSETQPSAPGPLHLLLPLPGTTSPPRLPRETAAVLT